MITIDFRAFAVEVYPDGHFDSLITIRAESVSGRARPRVTRMIPWTVVEGIPQPWDSTRVDHTVIVPTASSNSFGNTISDVDIEDDGFYRIQQSGTVATQIWDYYIPVTYVSKEIMEVALLPGSHIRTWLINGEAIQRKDPDTPKSGSTMRGSP